MLLAFADPQSITLSTEASPSMIQLVVVFGLMSLLPALVLTTTCFTRFVVVFSFLKTGLGTQGAPPEPGARWTGAVHDGVRHGTGGLRALRRRWAART